MKTPSNSPRGILPFLILALVVAGCESPSSTTPPETKAEKKPAEQIPMPREGSRQTKPVALNKAKTEVAVADPVADKKDATEPRREIEEEKEVPPEKDPPIPEGLKALNKEKTIYFEKTADGKRRVYVMSQVCLREGPLEVLLCKAGTKEHEAILSAELDARELHVALIAAGGKPGSTVKYVPEYKPASGDIIKITLTYNLDGKLLTKPAQSWVKNFQTKKEMVHDWVFAGSRLFQDPDDLRKPPYYCANNGEVVSIANFGDAMLDLPVKSSKENAELGFGAFTERIPPLKTKVLVMMEVQKAD